MVRVLVATPEPIGRRLAGPAIRAAHIARVAAQTHDVTLVSLAGESTSPVDGRRVVGPRAITGDYDAAIVQGRVLLAHPELAESETPLVIDWFDPFHVEALHRGGADRILRIDLVEGARQTLLAQAERGDFFLCSNLAQRDHWLGWLAAAGRLNHLQDDLDPLFDSLITVAPFGIGQDSATTGKPIRETFSVVGPHDPILLWAGGLHDWLDPLAVIKAMPEVLDENPDTRLVYMAGPHPNTSIETMGVRGEAIAMARDMRLFGTSVLFVNKWIDYAERLSWVRDATIGVVADKAHLESRLSHRTRLLDHLSVGLPTVSTAGDPLSSQLVDAGAARTASRDTGELGAVLASLVNDEATLAEMSSAARTLGATMSWDATMAPLKSWLENPRRAVDHAFTQMAVPTAGRGALDRVGARVRLHLDDGGPKQVLQRGVQAGRRRLGR